MIKYSFIEEMIKKIQLLFFFIKNKQYSFIHIDRVHQYNTNLQSYKQIDNIHVNSIK